MSLAADPALIASLEAAETRFYQALRQVHLGALDDLLASWSADPATTTMNAAGGYEHGPTAVQDRWRWWSTQGRAMQADRVERIAVTITPALACTVALEHHGPRILRVTHVWQREGERWRLLHRHADPLVERQAPPATPSAR